MADLKERSDRGIPPDDLQQGILEKIQDRLRNEVSLNNDDGLGGRIFDLLFKSRVLTKRIEDILAPFLENPGDLNCILTGSAREGRQKVADVLEHRDYFQGSDYHCDDYDLMLILNKKPVQQLIPSDGLPGFFYLPMDSLHDFKEKSNLESRGFSRSRIVSSKEYVNCVMRHLCENIQSPLFDCKIKKPSAQKSCPAVTLCFGDPKGGGINFQMDLVLALRTDMTLDEANIQPELLSELKKRSLLDQFKSLPIYIVPKSCDGNFHEWRISYPSHEDQLFQWLKKVDSKSLALYHHIEMDSYRMKEVEKGHSYIFKQIYLHHLIHGESKEPEKFCKFIIDQRVPNVVNTKVKILDITLIGMLHSSLFPEKEEKEEKFISPLLVLKILASQKAAEGQKSFVEKCEHLRITREKSPIHWTAMTGENISELVEMLRSGHAVNKELNGMTPLFVACLFCQYDVAEQLLRYKADVNCIYGPEKLSCLHAVCATEMRFNAEYVCSKVILDLLRIPCRYGGQIVKLLSVLENPQTVEYTVDRKLKLLKLLLSKHADVELQTVHGESAVLLAAQAGYLELVEELVANGADATSPSAILQAVLWQQTEIVSHLLPKYGFVQIFQGEKAAHNQLESVVYPSHLVTSVLQYITDSAGLMYAPEYLVDVELRKFFTATIMSAVGWTGNLQICQLFFQYVNGHFMLLIGRNILAFAAVRGHYDVFKTVLELTGSDNRVINESLYFASGAGHLNIVQLILEKGCGVDVNGKAALVRAGFGGHLQIVELLLKHGANPNIQAEDGRTAMLVACVFDNIAVVEMLLQYNAYVHKLDKLGRTPLFEACIRGHLELAKLLVESGGADVNTKEIHGVTALCAACDSRESDLVQFLVDHGADVNKQDMNGRTALDCSCAVAHLESVKILVQKGALVDRARSDNLRTPLHLACEAGSIELIQCLLRHGADVTRKDVDGRSAVMIACGFGRFELVKFFVNRGADVNESDFKGFTLPMMATSLNESEIVLLLIRNGAVVNKADNDGRTALMDACFHENFEIAKILVDNRADVNQQRIDGYTPLMIACRRKNIKLVKLFLPRSSAPNVVASLLLSSFWRNWDIFDVLWNCCLERYSRQPPRRR